MLQTRLQVLISDQPNQLEDLQFYCTKFANLIEKENFDYNRKVQAYHTLIGGFLKLKQYSQALKYLKKEKEALKFIPFSMRNAVFFRYWFSLDTATKDYKSAVYHLLEYNKVNDSIFNQTKAKQIEQLQIEYDIDKKDKNIKLLTQQKKIQDTELKQSALVRNIVIFSAASLLVILFLLFRQFKLKQRSTQIIQMKNAVLEHMVTEKEWLLKEVHHRVKNNLQIIISLLNTQSNYLESDAAVKAIRESQERMNAISLIHQKLYKSEDTAFINIREYVYELVQNIRNGFSNSSGILFDLNISDSQMDAAQAVPLGLILNEAVSNIFKYAFPGGLSGKVNISLNHSKDDHSFLLTISDNGAGLPHNYDLTKKASFGIRLMQGLSKQMGGSFTIENNNGVTIQVAFSESKVTKLMMTKSSKITSDVV